MVLARASSRPGLFWPPDRWDGTHFSAILLFFFLVVPFGFIYLGGYKSEMKKRASDFVSNLNLRRSRNRGEEDEAEGALQLEERLERGERDDGEETHILGDEDERTSEDEDSRPLLNGEESERDSRRSAPRRQGTGTSIPDTLPPGYEEATKEEETATSTQTRI